MSNDILQWLQHWYHSNCDGEWKRDHGVKVDTLGNSGWSVSIDLAETRMSGAEFSDIDIERDEHDWIYCSIKEGRFKGSCGGPLNFFELLEIFRAWVIAHEEHQQQQDSGNFDEWMLEKSFQSEGEPQYNPVTGQCVHPPHVRSWNVPGRIRPAELWEIP